MMENFLKAQKQNLEALPEEDVALISNLIPARSFDKETGFYLTDTGLGVILEITPLQNWMRMQLLPCGPFLLK